MRVFVALLPHAPSATVADAYVVRLHAAGGRIIVERTRQPLLDASRWYAGAGIFDQFEMWSAGATSPRLRGNIDDLSTRAVVGDARFGTWRAFSKGEAAWPRAMGGSSNAAELLNVDGFADGLRAVGLAREPRPDKKSTRENGSLKKRPSPAGTRPERQ